MKILIVSYYFSPANVIGAVRASKLSKYLNKKGHDVDVVCSVENKLLFMPNTIKIDNTLVSDTKNINKIFVNHSKTYKYLASLLKPVTKKLMNKNINSSNDTPIKNTHRYKLKKVKKALIHFFTYIMSLVQDYDFYFQYKKKYKESTKKDYDVVISSYGPLSSHLVANHYKRKNNKTKWIADFRDPIAQPSNGTLEYKINKKYEKNICKYADIVTAVSEGYLEKITKGNYVKEKHVITNGYDKEDYSKIESIKNDTLFSFVYTGTTYNGRRDLKPLFKALRALIDEDILKKEHIRIRYAGPDKNIINSIAKTFNMLDVLEAYDYIPRIEALKLQKKSKFLIVSTWNENQHTGVLPGKFLEYLMFDKPIIALVNGVQKNSEIKKMVEKYKVGICYEDINKKNDYIRLKNFLEQQYLYYIGSKTVKYEGNRFKVIKHDYENISNDFIDILSSSKKY